MTSGAAPGAAQDDGARAAAPPVLVLRGAMLVRGGGVVLERADWTLRGTGITCLMGLNGAGKTSLLRLMAGLEPPSAGAVIRPGGTRPAYLAQRPVMLRRSVRANLAYPLRLAGVPRAEALRRAQAQAEAFGLARLADRHAPALSGGEMQRLALARALIAGPRLILADEPTAALDGRATREVEARLAAAARGARVVMSTHDPAQVRRLAREVAFLHRGRLHERGPAARFLQAPRTPEAALFVKGDLLA